MRYGTRFGCRFGVPHDMVRLGENPSQVWERCRICNRTFRWNKGYKKRIENKAYLEAHVRQFAQDFGATKRVYHKLYKPKNTVIHV